MATSSDSKVALITGSTSGVGQGIANVLASKGYDIVVNGFGSPEVITAAVKEYQKRGARRVEYHGADLSKSDQIGEMFKFISEKFGHSPDILVNNAGKNVFVCSSPLSYNHLVSYPGSSPACRKTVRG